MWQRPSATEIKWWNMLTNKVVFERIRALLRQQREAAEDMDALKSDAKEDGIDAKAFARLKRLAAADIKDTVNALAEEARAVLEMGEQLDLFGERINS